MIGLHCEGDEQWAQREMRALVVRDLAFERWEFGVRGSEHRPTKKGRERVARLALISAKEFYTKEDERMADQIAPTAVMAATNH